MAGHSKWKNIRIRKGKQDALRGKLFTKLSREIIVAARSGGGDPATNSRLRVAVEKAREESLPKENIERAIKRGTGEIEGVNYEELVYEGYGPGGSAVMVEVFTENKNRTVADLRHAFTKCGGNLSENGSVSWQFKHVGQITLKKEGLDEEAVTLDALDAGAEDVQFDEEFCYVETAIENLHTANDALEKKGYRGEEVGLIRQATNWATPEAEDFPKILKLLDMLEDLDDVKETFINVEIPDEMMEE
ncbi:MAG TPA: YebC/PmpR family DNA-binding transcriptional regulator [Fimbriimonadaceae bacterium]|nr:YebC/PmpR family DNA-binding transcriptional regulator [Fimbriimonadaceae bacterium]HRJ32890.1 YebC/PmpR family DNA-binding transcriptional regulator [Fimbriimonadaceae bacterium]